MGLTDVTDGATGGAGGQCGVGLQRSRDMSPAGARTVGVVALGFHLLAPFGQFFVAEQDVDGAVGDVDPDAVTVFEQGDGTAFRGLGRDMADG